MVDERREFMISPETKMKQALLPFHGGPRPGSGRPKSGRTSHAARPRFDKPTPIHVVLQMGDHVWNLRSRRCFGLVQRALWRFKARLIEYSVQGNHLHLIVEADDTESLSRAMQGFGIRLAKALNALMRRAGGVFDDHYFARLLKTPTELVNAIRYVLRNHERHFGLRGADPFSSAVDPSLLAEPQSWLLRDGWRLARRW